MRIPKVKTQEEIELDIEIQKERDRVYNSQEFKDVQLEIEKLYKDSGDKERELRSLRRKAAERYINISYNFHYRGFLAKDKKSAVKVGIKKGLGVKHICLINDDDMKRIVKNLIEKDLQKTNEKDLLIDINNIYKKLDKLNVEKDKLFVKYQKLQDKLRAIDRKEKRVDLNKEKQKEINGKIIKEKLPDYIGKITEEVTKELIVDTLNKSNEMQNGTTK